MLLKSSGQWRNQRRIFLKKYFVISENINITFQNVWDTGKLLLRGKLLVYRLTSRKISNKQPDFT